MTNPFNSYDKLHDFASTFEGYSKSEIKAALKDKEVLESHLSDAGIDSGDVNIPSSNTDNPLVDMFFDLIAKAIQEIVKLLFNVSTYRSFSVANETDRTIYIWLKADGKSKENIAVRPGDEKYVLTHRDKWECDVLYIYAKDKKGLQWIGEDEEHEYDADGESVCFTEIDLEETTSWVFCN